MESQKFGVFLDADGVLWPDVGAGGILNGKAEAKRRLNNLIDSVGQREKIFIGVVTNQTLAARGDVPYHYFKNSVFSLFDILKSESFIDDFRVCFHHPNAINPELRITNCECRKPRPGMLKDLIAVHGLRPSKSVIIGDRITDILAGKKANIGEAILLNGPKMLQTNVGTEEDEWYPLIRFRIAKNFLDSLKILNNWIKHD